MNKKKKQNTTNYAGSAFAVILAALLSYFPINKQLNEQKTMNEPAKQEMVVEDNMQVETEIDFQEANAQIENGQGEIVINTENLEIPAKLKDRSERILKRTNYTVSYNRNWNLPNWVAWELNKNETKGKNNRRDEFVADTELPKDNQVEPWDYSGSGYDRGHMCPAGDNHYNDKAMSESFYMSNICPQNHDLNSGKWNDLEIACRRWANRYGEIFIVCGPIIDKRKGKTIGKNHEIFVPEQFFKCILITSTKPARAIGYIFENNGSDRPYKIHTIDEIEKITGMDFFPNLPDSIEDLIESRYEAGDWRWYN